jgi:carboxymethylenebutenolidase
MRLHVATPDAERAAGAGIMVFQEAFGVNDHMRDVARSFADLGLLAVVPELYHRAGIAEVPYSDMAAAVRVMNETITRDGLVDDIGATVKWLGVSAGLGPERLAAVGFCMGGRVSFIANAHHPLAAAIDFYGSITPAALDLADKQLGPLLLFWAGLDEYIRPEGTRKAADALNEAKKDFTEVTFSHADHGFFCDRRPAVYNANAARQAWSLSREFLATRGLLSSTSAT